MAKGKSSDEGKVDLKPSARRKEERAPSPKNRLLLILSGINLIVVGLVTGVIFAWQSNGQREVVSAAPLELMPSLAKAEELQRAGHPRRAMQKYREAATLPGAGTSALVYQMAVCAEQLEDFALASELYEQGTRHATDEIAAACTIGAARLSLKFGRADDALDGLSRLARVASRPIYTSSSLGANLQYLLALALSVQAAPIRTSPLHEDHYFAPAFELRLEEALSMVALESRPPQAQRRLGLERSEMGVRVYGTPRDPSTTLLSARVQEQPIAVLLELVAAETGWSISPSEVAREIVGAKSLDVFVRDKTVSELLTLVLEPQRLGWTFKDGVIEIKGRYDVPEERRASRQRVRAVALLQSALAEAPEHFFAPQAYLALGNVASFEGKFDRAQTYYREAVERFPQRSTAQRSTFNLAKSLYRNHDIEGARSAFFRVIDLRRGSQLEPLSYLYLGRIAFDEGDFKRATRELSRALNFAKVPLYEAAASITLAAVHLVREAPSSASMANRILFEHRDAFQEADFRNQVVYLSALTRYRTALRREDVRRREHELLAACMNVHPDTFFGDFGYLLLGRSFTELGLSSEAVQWFAAGIDDQELSVAMRHHLLFELAKEYQRQNEHALAVKLLDELAKSDESKWAPRAATRLAQLLYELQLYDQCIAHCRDALVRGYSEVENVNLLRQLGRVYEELGDHEMASLCFAGLLPSRPTTLAENQR